MRKIPEFRDLRCQLEVPIKGSERRRKPHKDILGKFQDMQRKS
jgi:hypothetical protein